MGIDEESALFLNTFLLYCLLEESPRLESTEYRRIKKNRAQVLFKGRDPQFKLDLDGCSQSPAQAGSSILERLVPVAELLDKATGHKKHLEAVLKQKERLLDPEQLPSAMILKEMRENQESYTDSMLRLSEKHLEHLSQGLSQEKKDYFKELAHSSIEKQRGLEKEETQDFDQFLEEYFSWSSGEGLVNGDTF